ncbi:hypothetical protein QTP86_023236 [Hemibagrus guttatus]|nr:hypothetical protein QTP86_023236 [Hemibagrus guttatus]
MASDVRRYVQGCRDCAISKSPRHLPSGKLLPLPVPNRPWLHLGVDFITDLPASNDCTCIFVVVDRFSKSCRLIPLKGLPTAMETAELMFNHIFRYFGIPEYIVSDRGPQFISREVIKRKSKKRIVDGVYEILDQVENKGGEYVKRFWRCVFQYHIQQKYPVFRFLQNSLKDDSFRNCVKDGERDGKQHEQKEGATKRKRGDEEINEEEPGPSSGSIQKEPAKEPTLSSLLKRGELPVTCGENKGILYPDRLAKGEECILSQDQWFTPGEFERFSGKESHKNWKLSIRYQNTPLQKLIKEGHLKCPHTYRRYGQKRQTVSFSPVVETYSPQSASRGETDESDDDLEECIIEEDQEEEEEDEEEEDHEPTDLSKLLTLPVSCGSVSGILYKSRFAGGSRSKSIRTEERWFTPQEFVMEDLRGGHWKRDILCRGKTLNYLVEKTILKIHSLVCQCRLCRPEENEQDNDDVCYICNSGGRLVCCDECPRAFHHCCHLPVLYENALGRDWICTYCVSKQNMKLWIHMNRKGALMCPVSSNMMRCEYLLLFLYKADTQHVLTDDPSKRVDRYTKVIPKPMWLNKVKTKLQENEYKTVGQFVGDIRLIFNNCQTFYRDNKSGKMGAKLKKQFEKEFNSVFKIQQMNPNQMDQLDHLPDAQLAWFFRSKKTEMSCLEEPQILLSQLRDNYLVPEDLYQKVTKAKTKKTKQKFMYQILDWVENERRQCMKLFWSCVFQDHILQHYPVFRLYQTSLLNERKKTEKKVDGTKRKKCASETEETEPGPSSVFSINQVKPAKKPCTDSVTK